jgi:hypothetical protein
MGLRSLSRREFVLNAAATALLMPVYHRREWRSREANRAWQLSRITRLVQRAYEQVPSHDPGHVHDLMEDRVPAWCCRCAR